MKKLVLATRRSPLALVQTGRVASHLADRLGAECELLELVTIGDRQADWSLEQKGGKGLFTRELEAALLRGEADVAVHSTKDMPGAATAGLEIAGYLRRDDPHDVLVLRAGVGTPKTLATGSPRRRLQALMLFPEVVFQEIRGNVDTRLRKIGSDHLADGTVLAAAGLNRLGIAQWPGVEFHALGFDSMVPAVGQGAIAVQCRSADAERFSPHLDGPTRRAVTLERALQELLGAGCHTAFAALAAPDTLHFFHQDTGLRTLPLSDDDFAAPTATARRLLKQLGLLK